MVHVQPHLIKLANSTPAAFNKILEHLHHENKRNLFLTNRQLQNTLKTYSQMKQFTSQTLTFRFPQTPFHKEGKPYYGKPNNIKPTFIKKHVNPQASLIQCQTCDVLYYNAKFEKTFLSCDQHAKYRWEKARPTDTKNNKRMIIAEKTPGSKKGHKHTSKQPFFPICKQYIPHNQTSQPRNQHRPGHTTNRNARKSTVAKSTSNRQQQNQIQWSS